MRVFQMTPDFTFQSFYTYDPSGPEIPSSIYGLEMLEGRPMMQGWVPLPLFAGEPRRKVGNFAKSWGGGILVDSHSCEILQPALAGLCELLPMLPYGRKTFYVMNVLECVDCLDETATHWRVSKHSGIRYGIDKYVFSKDRLSAANIFTIPQSPEIMVATGLGSSTPTFKSIVDRNKLTGLKFRELWSSDEKAATE